MVVISDGQGGLVDAQVTSPAVILNSVILSEVRRQPNAAEGPHEPLLYHERIDLFLQNRLPLQYQNGSGPWSVVSGQCPVLSGQWPVDSNSLVNCQCRVGSVTSTKPVILSEVRRQPSEAEGDPTNFSHTTSASVFFSTDPTSPNTKKKGATKSRLSFN